MIPIRRIALLALLAFSIAGLTAAATIYRIELRGHSQLLSSDHPVQKGKVLLFHRYPDGVFLSVAAREVIRVVSLTTNSKTKTLEPGETIALGPTGEGETTEAGREHGGGTGSRAGRQGEEYRNPSGSFGPYGYSGFAFYGLAGVPSTPAPRPLPAGPPSLAPNGFPANPSAPPQVIGPNGFPTLAPPSSPAPKPQSTGPNGFPALAPSNLREAARNR